MGSRLGVRFKDEPVHRVDARKQKPVPPEQKTIAKKPLPKPQAPPSIQVQLSDSDDDGTDFGLMDYETTADRVQVHD